MVRFHLLPPNPSWGYNSVGRVAALQAACRRFESDYLHQSEGMYLKHFLIFENWKLEIKENYNSYNEIDNPKGLSVARKISC